MKNETKQTAVEWLEIEVKKFNTVITKEYILLLCQQAKEMEKEQIMNAFDECGNWQDNYTDSEHFYNETYGGNK
jgi:hypothetical protein